MVRFCQHARVKKTRLRVEALRGSINECGRVGGAKWTRVVDASFGLAKTHSADNADKPSQGFSQCKTRTMSEHSLEAALLW